MTAHDWLTLGACVVSYCLTAVANALLGDPLTKLGEYIKDRMGL
jgi:hypothetical protein